MVVVDANKSCSCWLPFISECGWCTLLWCAEIALMPAFPKAWFPFKLRPDFLLQSYKTTEKVLSRKNRELNKLKIPICEVANQDILATYKNFFYSHHRMLIALHSRAKTHFLKGFNAHFIANLIFVFACSTASSYEQNRLWSLQHY